MIKFEFFHFHFYKKFSFLGLVENLVLIKITPSKNFTRMHDNVNVNYIISFFSYLEQQILQILSISEYENSNETSSESEGEETSKTMIVKKRRQRREN
jgi:hypothetical protein